MYCMLVSRCCVESHGTPAMSPIWLCWCMFSRCQWSMKETVPCPVFFVVFVVFLCLFLQSSRAMFENSHIWQIHVTMINMIALLFLLTCERVLELRSLDSIIPSSSLTSFDICAMFLLPVWQPEASKPPFLNMLKRTTLFLSCLTCMHPATTVGYFYIQRTA